MSGIVALHHRDGHPVPERWLGILSQAASYRGPDGVGHWEGGRIALAHLHQFTTPEAELESQPLHDPRSDVCITWDGRLDNREDLVAQLGDVGTPPVPDVDLVLRAYQRWDLSFLDHLVGDFALALWDGHHHRLLCARDPLGVRPLHYAVRGPVLAVTSGVPELLALDSLPREINEGFAGELLTGNVYSTTETLYRHVQRLAPGHLLTMDGRGLQITRYWSPTAATLQSVPEGTISERFLELFQQAVACRARSCRPIAADLSGGVDSSSVVSVLAGLASRDSLTHPFTAFSLAFPGRACDETPYAKHVVEQLGITWNRVVVAPLPAAEYAGLAHRDRDFPGYPNGTMARDAVTLARRQGMDVQLTGVGGDEWWTPAPLHTRCLDLARQGRFVELTSALSHVGRRTIRASLGQLALRGSARLGLGALTRQRWRARLPRWLNPAFVLRIDLLDRLEARSPSGAWDWSHEARWRRGTAAWNVHALEVEERHHTRAGVEVRHPFLDRRLVEFALALPETELEGALGDKAILRRALRGILPDRIRLRRDKVEFSHLFSLTLAAPEIDRSFASWSNADHPDWIFAAVARQALQDYRRGDPKISPWPLWALYGLDAWWQSGASLAPPGGSPR